MGTKVKITRIKNLTPKILKSISRARGLGTFVGVFKDAGHYKKTGEHVAQVAMRNEFGTANIPARPFMRTGMETNLGVISKIMKEETIGIVTMEKTVRQALDSIGFMVAQMIRNRIRMASSWAVPNAVTTIKLKGGNTPLVDSTKLMRSIKSKTLVKKGKK